MIPEEFLHRIENYRQLIDRELSSLIDREEPKYLYDPIRHVFRGKGKRLRPILVLLVAKSFGSSLKKTLPAALSVEILHNFSLVHDDIMDQDDTRHGLPTIHAKWDESTAILAGDAIFTLAYRELTKLGNFSLDCIRAFNHATLELCEGQALDKTFEVLETVTLQDYLQMIRLKTGALLALCCELGGIISRVKKETLLRLCEFGELVGQAFQIQDDLFEIFSTKKQMGKSLGSDVLTSKKTYLTCKAAETDLSSWKRLTHSFLGEDLREEILPKLRNYFEETGLVMEAKNDVNSLISKAKLHLEKIDDRCENLVYFVDLVMSREN